MENLGNLVDYGVIGLLLVLSIWAIAVAVERWLFYRRVELSKFPDQQRFEIALTKRLVIIGTVAANAPYIGLLGTVLGIMLTFQTMGTSKTIAVSTIMVGLSLALKATAMGTACGHSLCGVEQYPAPSGSRTADRVYIAPCKMKWIKSMSFPLWM